MLARTIAVTVACAILSCSKSPDDGQEHPLSSEIEFCEEMCAKQLCTFTIDPADNFEQVCADQCTATVEQTDQDGCLTPYIDLLECLDGAACGGFQDWLDQESSSPCVIEEETLDAACPGIEVRW